MALVGWAFVGIVLGAAGVELLRASMPELVEKVEDAAKRLVDSLCPEESSGDEKAGDG